jgi:hypothetical protein
MTRLSDSEIDTYRSDGLVVPNFRLSQAKLDILSQAVDDLVGANPDIPPEYLVGPHIPRHYATGPDLHQIFLAICMDSEVLDMVEDLIGSDIILWSSGVFCKPATVGRTVPWHQDGKYWPIRPLATCSVWIAIDDALPDNGCMRYIPGSHSQRRLWRHELTEDDDQVLNQQVASDQFDVNDARDDILHAGQMSLHDVYLIHGSNANVSGRRRAGYVMRYIPGTSLYDREMEVGQSSNIGVSDFKRRPIWLLRGVDRTDRNDFGIGHQLA